MEQLNRFRFRHCPLDYLASLEIRWEQTSCTEVLPHSLRSPDPHQRILDLLTIYMLSSSHNILFKEGAYMVHKSTRYVLHNLVPHNTSTVLSMSAPCNSSPGR